MISEGKGNTEAEIFFVSKVNDGTISVNKDGIVFNNKTNRHIGAIGSGAYPKISMKCLTKDKIFHIQIHRLLWIVYNGDIDNGMVINHIDFDKSNNNICNLELVTLKQNSQHYVKSEKFKSLPGESNGNSKLKDDDVRNMRKEYKDGKVTVSSLARRFNVHEETIKMAISGKHYFNVK